MEWLFQRYVIFEEERSITPNICEYYEKFTRIAKKYLSDVLIMIDSHAIKT